MIAFLSFVCILGVFWAGHIFGAHLAFAVIWLGVSCVGLGSLIAAAEMKGFEGQRVIHLRAPWTWEKLTLNVARLSLAWGKVASAEPLYVMTDHGAKPVTGLFTARINHERSLVLDITQESIDEPLVAPHSA